MTENNFDLSDEETNSDSSGEREQFEHVVKAELVSEKDSTVSSGLSTRSIAGSSTAEEVVEEEEGSDDSARQRAVGAGIAVGLITMPFGLILSILAGVGAAYGTKKDGPTGEVCRAAGEVALAARDKAVELNNEHHLVDKAKEGVREGVESAKEADKKFRILERIGNGLKHLATALKKVAENIRKNDSNTNHQEDESSTPPPPPLKTKNGYEEVDKTEIH